MSPIFACLDNRALNYLRDRLANANPLGQRVLAEVRLDSGAIGTILPAPTPYNFVESISSTNESKSGESAQALTRKAVLKQVVAAFHACSGMAIVSESYNLRVSEIPPDVLLGRNAARYLPGHTGYSGEFVYHFASSCDSEATIESVIHSAYEQPVGLSVIFRSNHVPFQIQGKNVTAILDEAISNIVAVSVSAYDGESLVVWQNSASRLFPS